jgi:hypothetical protein
LEKDDAEIAGAAKVDPMEQPYGKINHVVVLPKHRGRGVGTLLFKALLGHLATVMPAVGADLRLVCLEYNGRALEWYWKLGFAVVEMYTDRFESDDKDSTVVYLRMRRHTDLLAAGELGAPIAPSSLPRFFGKEVAGHRAFVLHESEPGPLPFQRIQGFARWKPTVAGSASTASAAEPSYRPVTVRSFDEKLGLHGLADGRFVDLTDLFSLGRARFVRPLHEVFQGKWPRDEGAPAVEDEKAKAPVGGNEEIILVSASPVKGRGSGRAPVRFAAAAAPRARRPKIRARGPPIVRKLLPGSVRGRPRRAPLNRECAGVRGVPCPAGKQFLRKGEKRRKGTDGKWRCNACGLLLKRLAVKLSKPKAKIRLGKTLTHKIAVVLKRRRKRKRMEAQ